MTPVAVIALIVELVHTPMFALMAGALVFLIVPVLVMFVRESIIPILPVVGPVSAQKDPILINLPVPNLA
jgi:hypothetical protein